MGNFYMYELYQHYCVNQTLERVFNAIIIWHIFTKFETMFLVNLSQSIIGQRPNIHNKIEFIIDHKEWPPKVLYIKEIMNCAYFFFVPNIWNSYKHKLISNYTEGSYTKNLKSKGLAMTMDIFVFPINLSCIGISY